MERIDHVIRKIQELYYSKNTKQAIDIDLMMDFTRVLYADLLEWRSQFPETAARSLETTPDVQNTMQKEERSQSNVVAEEPHEELVSVDEEHKIVSDFEDEKQVAETNVPATDTENVSVKEVVNEMPQHEEHTKVDDNLVIEKTFAAAENILELASENEAKNVPEKELEGDIEDERKVVQPPVSAEMTAGEKPINAASNAIAFEPPTTIDNAAENLHQDKKTFAARKDIRSVIGINDKFQYINELFHNNKSNYEELLDQTNNLDSYENAAQWLITDVLPKHNWSKDDDTFQSFLATVKKHFS